MTLSLNVKQRISTFPCQISASSASHSKLAANLTYTFYMYSHYIFGGPDLFNNWINALVSPEEYGYFLDNVHVSCDPDAGGHRHGQLPGHARAQVDVEVLQQGPDKADQEHNHVEQTEPNKPSCNRNKFLLQKINYIILNLQQMKLTKC